jgi:hypothetical protein
MSDEADQLFLQAREILDAGYGWHASLIRKRNKAREALSGTHSNAAKN